ncbi:hypothetical protein CVS40_5446 [Lucilia cuprina]|nr:hypothetical protein CVS40_5446 [Lucilia cuprina]
MYHHQRLHYDEDDVVDGDSNNDDNHTQPGNVTTCIIQISSSSKANFSILLGKTTYAENYVRLDLLLIVTKEVISQCLFGDKIKHVQMVSFVISKL